MRISWKCGASNKLVNEMKAEVKARAKRHLFLTSNLTSFIYMFGGQTFQKECVYIYGQDYLSIFVDNLHSHTRQLIVVCVSPTSLLTKCFY